MTNRRSELVPRVVLYARYSSDSQRDASIEDQLRACRLHAERQGWSVVDSYTDRAISGASLLRPGIQELLQDAHQGQFSIVLAEAMDRLSRDQEDIAGLFKRLSFAGVRIATLSEGDVSALHVGLKGTMNALFLKDLADKTRRGLRGRVEAGKSGGGRCYGYDIVRALGPDGLPATGERRINQAEAAIIRRVFTECANGRSSRTIALALNAEGVPGPRGSEWGPSTIHGNVQRHTGLLNNDLYVGRLVWNRQQFIKEPIKGNRVARLNPEAEWVFREVPDLRIVEDALWLSVKERQASLQITPDDDSDRALVDRRRPRHLFSGLVRCGCCRGGYAMISKNLLGCSTRRNKGTCENTLNIRRDELERSVLNGLQDHLMQPALFKAFCEEFTREVNRLRIEAGASLEAIRAELPRLERQLQSIIEAVKDGLYQPSMKAEMVRLEARKAEVEALLAGAVDPAPMLHPSMADMYRLKVSTLASALACEDTRAEAAEVLRSLVTAIELTPEDGKLSLTLRGDLAGILSVAADKQKPGTPQGVAGPSQLSLVAGTGFEPVTFRL